MAKMPGNTTRGMGANFCAKFYRACRTIRDIRALTVSEAIEADGQRTVHAGNFSRVVDQCEFRCVDRRTARMCAPGICCATRARFIERVAQRKSRGATIGAAARAYEAVLAAEGSDWNWWYGPEHGSANDAEFDALYRKHLTEIYAALGEPAPEVLAHPIKKAPELARREPPESYLDVKVDGRETSYFEWLGAGLYATDPRGGTMHGRTRVLGDLYYGFGETHFYLRVDPVAETIAEIPDFQLRLTLWDSRETRITVRVAKGKFAGCVLEQGGACLLHPETMVTAAFGKIIEVGHRARIVRSARTPPTAAERGAVGRRIANRSAARGWNARAGAGRRKFRMGNGSRGESLISTVVRTAVRGKSRWNSA